MKMSNPEWEDDALIRAVVMSRNIVPLLTSGIAPLSAMSGRNDLLAALDDGPMKTLEGLNSLPSEYELSLPQKNVLQILELRNKLSHFEATRIIAACAGRRLRMGSTVSYSVGDVVEAFFPAAKLWKTGFRITGILASQVILERGRQLFKHPMSWIRKKNVPHMVNTQENDVIVLPQRDTPSSSSNQIPVNAVTRMCSNEEEPVAGKHEICLAVDEISDMVMEPTARNLCTGRNPSVQILRQDHWVHSIYIGECDGNADGKVSSDDTQNAKTLEHDTDDDSEPDLIDPARIPPRIFLKSSKCREAIKKEMGGLVQAGVSGIPSLVAVSTKDNRYNKLPRVHAAMIVKGRTRCFSKPESVFAAT